VGLNNYQVVQIRPQPDQTLTGWYVPSQNGAAILLLQGHWLARDGMLPEAEILARHGYGVMLLDPHPCAGSGVVHTMGQAEIADIVAAVKFMQQQPDIMGDTMGVLGFSMGGVLAVESAARLPEIRAVVAEGNFDDLTTNITPRGARDTLVGSLVQSFIVFFFRYYTGTDPASVRPINSVAKISPRPLLLIAGEHEAAANRTQAQFEAAGPPKELWLVPQVGHGGYGERWPEEYERRIVSFFNGYLLAESP
jgi:pimeloyl-ACP methyl ester carboxylesterase